jgi:FAD/FMN-containing dehydrogenase
MRRPLDKEDPMATRSLDPAASSALRASFGGEIVLPVDARYDAARAVWNGMIDRRPAIVVRPTGVADVVSAVRFAREQDLVVAVRSGGHSIPGFSTCEGGIVIDLSRMGGVTVDAGRRIARSNGGALLAELDDAAQAAGLVCPVGVVSHTGVAGLTLGGGMGRLHRRFGLTIDNLEAVELVTADGRTVRASAHEEPELFWGMRGAGPNFGIATAFEFRLHPFDGRVTRGWVVHPAERALEVAAFYRELLETSPDELFAGFDVGRALPEDEFPREVAGRPVVFLGVLHSGPPEQAERDLAGVRSFGPPIIDRIEPMTYLEAQHKNDDAMQWGHRFYMKSGFTTEMPDELVESWVGLVEGTHGDCSVGAWPWDRAISRVADDDMAFTGRTARYWLAVESLWDDPDLDGEMIAATRRLYETIVPYEALGRYVNDTVESGRDVVRSVYGVTKYERLVALKRTWDPDNVFRLNQNIEP